MHCPRCGFDNIDGMDRCENCLEPFRDRDVPQAAEGIQRLLMEEAVSSLDQVKALVALPSSTVADAVRQMKQNDNGCILVESNGAVIGILTERDLVLKVAGRVGDLQSLTVEEVMTRNPE